MQALARNYLEPHKNTQADLTCLGLRMDTLNFLVVEEPHACALLVARNIVVLLLRMLVVQ